MGVSVLVVSAHPDDEALGCGGTIATHVARGDRVHLLIFTDGSTGVRGFKPDRKWRQGQDIKREASGIYSSPGWRNAHQAAAIFGIASIQIRGFPDTRFETAPILDYAHEVEVALHVHRPTIVYTHHGGDLNMDHRWVHQAVVAACRPKPGSTVQFLLFYETPSATEWAQGAFQPFVPTVFQPLSQAAWDAKEKALTTAYGVEMRGQGHPRSIEAVRALAVVRGAACGKPMAEAFMPSRLVMSE